jgi:hypothetical protein
MKKDKKKKLVLSRERLRLLDDTALSNVQGGTCFTNTCRAPGCTNAPSGCGEGGGTKFQF